MTINSFIDELSKLGIELDDTQLNQLEKYYELLVEYNKVMNLTGITEKNEVYLKHFYDSITLVKAIDLNNYESLCDIGTGAGFPGLVLKIVYPKLNITLIDSLQKRINFLNIVIEKLNLKNIETIHSRIEEYGCNNREKYDIVTARAVASTNVLLEYSIPIVKTGGYFIPMKGKIDTEPSFENAQKKLGCTMEEKIEFLLPYENSNRTLIKFKKDIVTNKKYPRKFSEIKKNPL
jgi:16S rRNA (guanine527-N7)-methyltransferase